MKANTKKLVIAGGVVGVLAIAGIIVISRSKRKKLEAAIKEGSKDVLVPAAQTSSTVLFPLKYGSGVSAAEKNAVKVVQRYINARGKVGLIIMVTVDEDGIFGSQTEQALYNLAKVKEVSYSLYQKMKDFLADQGVPQLLNIKSKDTVPASTDPAVAKNNLVDSLLGNITDL